MIAYAITDPSTLNFNRLQSDLKHISKKATMIVYRDKITEKYEENAKLFLHHALNFERVLLHSDYKLAYKLNADGVHLKSTQFKDIREAKSLGLFVIISTHTLEEVKKAEDLGADMVTLSPIFYSPSKGLPLGVKKLNIVISSVSIPVIALGGIITQEHINSCVDVGVSGFASIRYFMTDVLNAL